MSTKLSSLAFLFTLVIFLSGFTSEADEFSNRPQGGHPHPELTDTQKNCLKEQGLPPPGEGERPEFSKVQAAFKACNIPAPPAPPSS